LPQPSIAAALASRSRRRPKGRAPEQSSRARSGPASADQGRGASRPPGPRRRWRRRGTRAFACEQRGRLAEFVLGDCAQPDPVLFGRTAHELRDSGDRCLADARKYDQASPRRTSQLRSQVAIQTRVCRQELTRRAWDWREPVKVFGWAPLDRHRQDLERSGDCVVQLACRRDRRVPLVRPKEIEVDRRNLEGPKELLPFCLLLGARRLNMTSSVPDWRPLSQWCLRTRWRTNSTASGGS